MLEIRPSYPDEFWRIEAMIPAVSQETRFRDRPIDVQKIKMLYDYQFSRLINTICYLAILDDQCVGFGAFVVNPSFFGHDLTASDLMLYVVPEKRGSTIAHRIIKKYEEWAISQNVTEISLGISTGISVERTSKFYEALGYRQKSVTYVKHP